MDVDTLWLEDQRIQAAWDQFTQGKPVCALCGQRILSLRALKLEDGWFCGDCVSRNTREVEES